MQISILIVDDDKLLVQKLYETLNWEALGIGMVFTAYNIRQAQKYLEDYPIELLLCDIDMPQGSGLELLEWIRHQKMEIECAFLSSYANFAYAQKALKLSSREYLLKPISNNDLEHALSKLVDIVRQNRKPTKLNVDNRIEEVWKDILLRRLQENLCIQRAVDAGLYKKEDQIVMKLIKIWESPSSATYKQDIALYDFVLRNICEEFFLNDSSDLESIVRMTDLEWMLVFRLNTTVDTSMPAEIVIDSAMSGSITVDSAMSGSIAADSAMSGSIAADSATPGSVAADTTNDRIMQLKNLLEKGFSRKCFVFLGDATSFEHVLDLRDRLELMEANAVPDEGGILASSAWTNPGASYQTPPWEAWEKEMVRLGQLLHTRDSILDFTANLKSGGYIDARNLRRFVRELNQLLYNYLHDQNIDFEQIFDLAEYQNYEAIADLSIGALYSFVNYIFEKLDGNRQSDNRQESIILQLKDYIDQHLGENLSRTVLASNVYLSEDYISKIFVRMTGMSIPNYIAARRIEKAREYISNSSLPISKIALEVGYSNFSYFSKTFRDLVGCTPNEYRSRCNKK